MDIIFKKELDRKAEALVLGMWAEEKECSEKLLAKEVEDAGRKKAFNKEKFGQLYCTSLEGRKVLIFALGKKDEFTLNHFRRVLGKAVKAVKSQRLTSFSTSLAEKVKTVFPAGELGRGVAEGLLLSNYAFIKYFSAEKQAEMKTITSAAVQWTGEAKLEEGIKMGRVIAEATNYVKDLVNEPASVVTPTYLENEAKKLQGGNIKVRVMNKEEMKKEGLNVLLGVNQGSHQPPKLIFIEYMAGKGKPTAIVGKGITFDSGGEKQKPARGF